MLRIAITTSSFDESNLPVELRGAVEVVRNDTGRRLTEAEAATILVDDVVGLIAGVEPLSAEVLRSASALRAIARVGTGVDNVDLAVAEELGIAVSRTPDAPTDAVAELTVGLMLAALRRIPAMDRAIRSGAWPKSKGRLLRERTVGLIGAGRIGQAVAARLHGFGCTVLFSDPFITNVPAPARLTDLDVLLEEADLVSLHVPMSAETHHLLGHEEFSRMRAGSIVVNVARGGLIDEQALLAALEAGQLAAAALDCFEEEPCTGPLLDRDDVVLSPHAGSGAEETRREMEREAANNLVADLRRAGHL